MAPGNPCRETLTDAAGVHDSNRIMLRFRPILPKPAASEGGVSVVNQNAVVSQRRTKRKYVRVRRNSGYARKNNSKRDAPRSPEMDRAAVVTLQLMPEKEVPEQASLAGASLCKSVDLDLTVEKIQIVENLKPPCATANADAGEGLDRAAAAAVVESWVTVESVIGTCMGEGEGGGLGCTDVEKAKVLETDTCPGFISDGYFRVRWINDAYKRMVVSESECGKKPVPEIALWLKVKDNAVWCCYSHPAFTCGVRLQYTWRNEKCTKMVPCDVWRLDCGGFAWRLDVKAALSLGL